jgi:predicted component of type VI protein secretion system
MDLLEFNRRAIAARRRRQAAHAAQVWPEIKRLREQGMGWRRIAAVLNSLGGISAPRGGVWHPNQVRRIYHLNERQRSDA